MKWKLTSDEILVCTTDFFFFFLFNHNLKNFALDTFPNLRFYQRGMLRNKETFLLWSEHTVLTCLDVSGEL